MSLGSSYVPRKNTYRGRFFERAKIFELCFPSDLSFHFVRIKFNLTLELIETRWCSCFVTELQLTVEPNVIFLTLARDGNSSYL